MRFEAVLDHALHGTGLRGPRILYHYTSWEAAENILRTQKFRATAHDCTNDKDELVFADATILKTAQVVLDTTSSPIVQRTLRQFLETYQDTRISASPRTYLACFSRAKDDPHQWREYGHDGAGVCIGLRLFGVPHPELPDFATGFFPIEYGDLELRRKIGSWHQKFVGILQRGDDIDHNLRLALETMNITATAWAVTTKALRWQYEQEVRMIFLAREGRSVVPQNYMPRDGTSSRFVEVPVTSLRRMPVEEFIVGPNQDVAAGVQRATSLLKALKYRNPERKVIRSAASVSTAA